MTWQCLCLSLVDTPAHRYIPYCHHPLVLFLSGGFLESHPKAVLELHLKHAVVYGFHSWRMGSYKYCHVCFLFLAFIIWIGTVGPSGCQFARRGSGCCHIPAGECGGVKEGLCMEGLRCKPVFWSEVLRRVPHLLLPSPQVPSVNNSAALEWDPVTCFRRRGKNEEDWKSVLGSCCLVSPW